MEAILKLQITAQNFAAKGCKINFVDKEPLTIALVRVADNLVHLGSHQQLHDLLVRFSALFDLSQLLSHKSEKAQLNSEKNDTDRSTFDYAALFRLHTSKKSRL